MRGCVVGLVTLFVVACNTPQPRDDASDAASPQASAMPAPLSPGVGALAGEAALVLRGDELIPSDVPSPLPKEGALSLEATLRSLDVPPLTRTAEVNVSLLEQARRKIEARLLIDFGTGRMRARLEGTGFLLPQGVELRARSDKIGHVVMFAGGARYRSVGPGALRSFFGEGRYDNVPFRATRSQNQGTNFRLGMRTRVVDVLTDRGKMTLELAKPMESLDSGALACRMLLELVGAGPLPSPCADAEVPLRAEIHWTTRGGLVFEATKVSRRTDLSALGFACPPATAEGSLLELPLADNRVLFSPSELAQFHTQVDVPVAVDAPKGLLLTNRTDLARIVWVDGVPIAHVAAQQSVLVPGLARGRYVITWRTALDDRSDGPFTIVVPGKADLGVQEVAK